VRDVWRPIGRPTKKIEARGGGAIMVPAVIVEAAAMTDREHAPGGWRHSGAAVYAGQQL